MNSGQPEHDVSEAEYIAQENQYFKTAALGHGVLYFRAFNLILLPLLAMVFWPDIPNRGVFLVVLCAALLINTMSVRNPTNCYMIVNIKH